MVHKYTKIEQDFGLTGKQVRLTKGYQSGEIGKIVAVTGWVQGHGVVALIKLKNGITVERSIDFWEEL